MQYTPRTPDHVIDQLYAMPCQLCGGGGEIGVEDIYGRMEPSNSPYADERPCYACDGTGIETRPWIINGEDGNIA